MALVHDSICDFLPFPRDPTYLEMAHEDEFDPMHFGASTHSDFQHQYLGSSAYDSYPPVYSAAPQIYYNAPRYHLDVGKGHATPEQHYTPAGSPSPSTSQAFDHPPSTLTSASGASVRSTASSAVGSPYSHNTNTLPGHEQWTESRQGLGLAPGIIHNDGFGQDPMFPVAGMDSDLMFDDTKFPTTCVGESRRVFSSLFPTGQPSPSVSPCPALQSFIPASSTPSPMVSDPPSSRRNVTIDTILEEMNNEIESPRQTASPTSTSLAKPPREAFQAVNASISPPVPSNSFRSPMTPASAMSPYLQGASFPSSTYQRLPESRSGAVGSEPRMRRTSTSPTDRFTPYARPIPPPAAQDQFPTVQSQTSFFSQSSGRFIPPLESSCWFSLLTLVFSTKDPNSLNLFVLVQSSFILVVVLVLTVPRP